MEQCPRSSRSFVVHPRVRSLAAAARGRQALGKGCTTADWEAQAAGHTVVPNAPVDLFLCRGELPARRWTIQVAERQRATRCISALKDEQNAQRHEDPRASSVMKSSVQRQEDR